MFVPEPGNIRVLVYQLDEQGRHVRHTADHVVGHRSLLGRRRQSEVNRNDGAGGAETGLAVDNVHQRLFVRDRNRVLTFDIQPDELEDYPAATHVIGQPDFETLVPGTSRRKFRGSELIVDDEHQRLFVEDGERIVVFDIHPDRLTDYPEAQVVIGQPDFESRLRGVGPNRLSRAHGLAFDPDEQRLFVSDQNNNRILVFDVHPDRLENEPDAIAVLGQPDFDTTIRRFVGAAAPPEERRGTRAMTPGGLDYDPVYHRLFVSQLVDNRILVFDAAPGQMQHDPEAIAVLGQPDFTTFDPNVSRTNFAFPKDPSVDPDKQILYVSEGFPGGNRVVAFDIRPEHLRNGAPAVDVIGHVDDQGEDDFDRRMANDRLDARTGTMIRAVALDEVDHRLWVADEYNNRVLGFQLDSHNRLLELEARWVFGQKDFRSATAARSATGLKIPLAVAYDHRDKRLYVGDGWNDRVLIYDVDPAHLRPGGDQRASVVLGQADFETQDPRTERDRFDFAVDLGRGIASNMLPVGMAIDPKGRRAFVSDGGNNRILVFDIHKDRLRSGAEALDVIGQPDFTSSEARLGPGGLNAPGHLAFDPDGNRLFAVDNRHHRVLVFDVALEALRAGKDARFVLGQPDLSTTTPPERLRGAGKVVSETTLISPNGVAYDRIRQRLFVSDQGSNRVLTFDVEAARMRNNLPATEVYGQRDARTTSDQVESDLSAQDQLYDPRGLAFDSVNQQLYVTDSHWARLMIFTAADSSHPAKLAPGGFQRFSSLDPMMVLSPWTGQAGYGRLGDARVARGVYMQTRTRFDMDPLTEQQSRVLVSQSAATMRSPTRRTYGFADGRGGTTSWVSVVNPSSATARLDIRLRDQDGTTTSASHVLSAGESLRADLSALMEHDFATAAFTVTSDVAVAVAAWTSVENRRGEIVETTLPTAAEDAPRSMAVANVMYGGGFQTDIVLMNPESEPARGFVALFDHAGKELEHQLYVVEPGAALVWQPPTTGLVPRSGYVRVRPTSSMQPAMATIVRREDAGLITMTSSPVAVDVERGSLPVNTMPDLIRHGRRTSLDLVIANPGAHGAAIRMILRDLEGREVGRAEQLILPESQSDFTLASLFDRARFAGSLTLVSDVPVAVSARQVTVNVVGDEILTELPVMALTGGQPVGPAVFPFTDGDGASTQMFLLSSDGEAVETELQFFAAGGQSLEVLLR